MLETKGQLVLLVLLALLVLWENEEPTGQEAPRETRGGLECLVFVEIQVKMVSLEMLVPLVHLVLLDQEVRVVPEVQWVPWVKMASLVQQG